MLLENRPIGNPQLLIRYNKARNKTNQREGHVLVETDLTGMYQIEETLNKRWALHILRGRETNNEESVLRSCTRGIHVAAGSQGCFLSFFFFFKQNHMSHTWKRGKLIYFCNTWKCIIFNTFRSINNFYNILQCVNNITHIYSEEKLGTERSTDMLKSWGTSYLKASINSDVLYLIGRSNYIGLYHRCMMR